MRHIDLKPIEDQPAEPESEFALEAELRRQRIKEQERLAAEQARANVVVRERQAEREEHDSWWSWDFSKLLIPFFLLGSVPFMISTVTEIKNSLEPHEQPQAASAKPSTQATPAPLYTVKDITPNLRYYEFSGNTCTGSTPDGIEEAISSLVSVSKVKFDFSDLFSKNVCNLHVERKTEVINPTWDDQGIDSAIKAAIAAHCFDGSSGKAEPCATPKP